MVGDLNKVYIRVSLLFESLVGNDCFRDNMIV